MQLSRKSGVYGEINASILFLCIGNLVFESPIPNAAQGIVPRIVVIGNIMSAFSFVVKIHEIQWRNIIPKETTVAVFQLNLSANFSEKIGIITILKTLAMVIQIVTKNSLG